MTDEVVARIDAVLGRLDQIEAGLVQLAHTVALLTDALIEPDEVDPAGMTLDGPIDNAERDQTQPL